MRLTQLIRCRFCSLGLPITTMMRPIRVDFNASYLSTGINYSLVSFGNITLLECGGRACHAATLPDAPANFFARIRATSA